MMKKRSKLYVFLLVLLMLVFGFSCALAELSVELDDGDGHCYAKWRKTDNGHIQFQCEVYNHHPYKTVRAFEMYAYATDVWNERMYGETTFYYHTTKKNIEAGRHVYSEYITMPDYNDVYQVYAGIKRVIYTDGTKEEVPDYQVDYSSWTIKK